MHSFFIHNLYSVPTFLESGLYYSRLNIHQSQKSVIIFVIFLKFVKSPTTSTIMLCKSHFEHFSYIFRRIRLMDGWMDGWMIDRFNFKLHHIFMYWKLYLLLLLLFIFFTIFFKRQCIWLVVCKIKTNKQINVLFIKNIFLFNFLFIIIFIFV